MPDAVKRALGETYRRHIAAVQEILRRWDPIGVIPDLLGAQVPPNEYDTYAPPILRMLKSGSSVEDLSQHLNQCRSNMALNPNAPQDRQAAEELASWWRQQS